MVGKNIAFNFTITSTLGLYSLDNCPYAAVRVGKMLKVGGKEGENGYGQR